MCNGLFMVLSRPPTTEPKTCGLLHGTSACKNKSGQTGLYLQITWEPKAIICGPPNSSMLPSFWDWDHALSPECSTLRAPQPPISTNAGGYRSKIRRSEDTMAMWFTSITAGRPAITACCFPFSVVQRAASRSMETTPGRIASATQARETIKSSAPRLTPAGKIQATGGSTAATVVSRRQIGGSFSICHQCLKHPDSPTRHCGLWDPAGAFRHS